jgi:NADPH2:quinone reductase
MKAWLLEKFTGIESLRLAEIPEPDMRGDDEAILEVEFAGLNPADRYLAEGAYPGKPPLPHILGRDGVGHVVAAKSDAGNALVGKRMLVLRGDTGVHRPGTFAERVAVKIADLMEPPAMWSVEESAGAALVYLTAQLALTHWGELRPAKDRAAVVLVTGASGGVGVACIQLGHAMGHRVVGLSRSEEKRRKLKDMGAAIVLDPMDENWPRTLAQEIGKQCVDLAIDNIGGAGFSQILDTLGLEGRVSVVGRLAGPVPEFNTSALLFRQLRIGGVAVGNLGSEKARHLWPVIVGLLGRNGVKPLVDQVFAFENLEAAFDRLKRGPMGKVLVRVRG